MNFARPEEQQMLAEMAADFATRKLAPEAAAADAAGCHEADRIKAVADLGLLTVSVAEDEGGAGLGESAALVVAEALAQGDSALALKVAEHDLGLSALLAAGLSLSEPLRQGRALVSWATVDSLTVEGDLVSGVVVAPRLAAWLAIEHEGALYLVPGEAAIPRGSVDDLGLRAASRSRLELKRVQAHITASSCRDLRLGAIAIGVGRAALRVGVEYAHARKQFGKPISQFQAIQWMLADSATRLDAAGLLVQRAVDAPAFVAGAVELAMDAAAFTTDAVLQIHGGYGYTAEYPIERLYRDARALALRL